MQTVDPKLYEDVIMYMDMAVFLLDHGYANYTTHAVTLIEKSLIGLANSQVGRFGATTEITELDAALWSLQDTQDVQNIKRLGNLQDWLGQVRALLTEADTRRAVLTLCTWTYNTISNVNLASNAQYKERLIAIKCRVMPSED